MFRKECVGELPPAVLSVSPLLIFLSSRMHIIQFVIQKCSWAQQPVHLHMLILNHSISFQAGCLKFLSQILSSSLTVSCWQ